MFTIALILAASAPTPEAEVVYVPVSGLTARAVYEACSPGGNLDYCQGYVNAAMDSLERTHQVCPAPLTQLSGVAYRLHAAMDSAPVMKDFQASVVVPRLLKAMMPCK